MQQLPEIIQIDGVLHTLYTTPLLPWLRQLDSAPGFDRRTPNCERGYVGRWKIEDDTLWLTGLYAWRDGKYTGLSDLFGCRSCVKNIVRYLKGQPDIGAVMGQNLEFG